MCEEREGENVYESLTFLPFILLHWPRLTQPDPPSRIQTLLRRGSKFRYSGRTLRQTQKAKLDRPDHNFTRYVCLSYSRILCLGMDY